jgi:hypothetical protein
VDNKKKNKYGSSGIPVPSQKLGDWKEAAHIRIKYSSQKMAI